MPLKIFEEFSTAGAENSLCADLLKLQKQDRLQRHHHQVSTRACQYAPHLPHTPPPSPPPSSSSPPLSLPHSSPPSLLLTKGHHSDSPQPSSATISSSSSSSSSFVATTSDSCSYLPSPAKMYGAAAAVGVGMLSPTLRPTASLPLLKQQTQASPTFRDGGEKTGSAGSMTNATANMAAGLAQAYSRASQSDSVKLQRAASLVYAARMRQEGFPYGLSGVPAMSSYNYSSELYGYASNGFPRKSRICSYCSKVFTRSTTRRYHEKRCPLLRAAGSLMKGNSNSSSACNGYSTREHTEGGMVGDAGMGAASRPPPPLLPATAESSSPPLAASKSTSVNTSPTSESLGAMARAQTLSTSQCYAMYGSHYQRSAMSTSATSPGQVTVTQAGHHSTLDHNQNSIMPVVKQEPAAEPEDSERGEEFRKEGEYAKGENMNGEAFLLRKVPAQGEEEEGGGGQHAMMYSNPSPNSRSRSENEEGESDDGEQAVKPPMMGGISMDSSYMHMQQLALKRYKLAQLMALQSTQNMTRPANMLYLPVPCVTNMTSSEKPSPEPGTDTHGFAPQKEAEIFPSHNPEDNNQNDGHVKNPTQEDDNLEGHEDDDNNTESYYEPHDNVDTNEMDEEEEREETEEEKKCGVCKEDFDEKRSLVAHMRLHQRYKPNCCRYCGQRFIKLSMRISHQRTHVGNFRLGCVVCGLHVLTKFGLRQHVHREHYHLSVGMTECRYCHTVIDNVYDLRVHFLSHRQEVALSERFSIQLLRSPLPELAVSPLEEESSHDLPPASIDSKASHDSHTDMESEPPHDPPPLLGPILPSMTSPVLEQGSFRGNGATSSGRAREKDWCRICEKEVPKSAMRYHEREHADQKPYECSLCKKRFGYKNNMKSHMKLHAGIKPYQCQVCGAKFTRGSTLRRHARRHGFNSDTIWDFFVRKNAASRTAIYSQGVEHAMNPAPERQVQGQVQGQGQISPVSSGARAMKMDTMFMGGMKAAEPGVVEKSRQVPGYSPGNAAPQHVMNASYPAMAAGPQPMVQPCMTTHQYLRYAATFSSANNPPPPPPQPTDSEEALDFSMPEKQRRRSSSSSSSISTQRSPSSSSSLGLSPSMLGAGQASHCQSLPATLDRRRSMGSYSEEREMQEERRRNTISFHDSYYHYNKMRASRFGLRENMDHHVGSNGRHPGDPNARHPVDPNARHQVDPSTRHQVDPSARHPMDPNTRNHGQVVQSDTQNNSTQDTLCCYSTTPNKDHYTQKFHAAAAAAGCNPLDMTMSPRMSSKTSPWLGTGEEESLEKLLTSGRLFHCRPCDCYYTDVTMFRIHSKIHVPDHPYLCFLCREDCQDKVNFSRHMLAHLR